MFKEKKGDGSIKDIISEVFKKGEDLKNSEDKKNELMKKIGVKKLVFLVLGMDYNWVDGHKPTSKGARSDTIILVTMDLYNQEVRLLSIPRDLRVYYDEFGYYEKINAAVVLGGSSLTRKIISNLFGVHIDYVFIIKQQAIKNLVDSVGGVYIDVEKDMFYEDKWGNLRIDLKHGRQLLNGEQVIGYMRFRMDEEGDLGRMRRQNQAISQIMQQLPSKINSSNIFSVINNVLPYVQTDMKKEKIMLLINFMANFSIDYKSYRLLVEPVDIDGVSYVELKDYKETIKAWYRGYEKLGILNACSVDNNMEIFNKYIYGSNFYLNASDYLDDYVPFSIILHKDDNGKSSLYYKLPFGKSMTLKEFIYNRYVNSTSEIYLKKSFLYDNEISKLRDFYVSNDVVLILGEDSIEK
ncbi:MAG: LCP family protein [Candidatus Calescibacterium sp.]|nr:LCP family protein [Candidatus Calescibacterium sp.]MDW8132742.1 LCP family protein [Candidatus Calescibacterium sp.]